ncbi:hypothetical protein WJX72_002692 [[Myrmecia] bisecta]|uniref:AAA+ ATPase domain-containing protein n=1 Tax=[Myrmecia] bisecta TaxID=41462 RepID=A0AAW1R517_9CHLO
MRVMLVQLGFELWTGRGLAKRDATELFASATLPSLDAYEIPSLKAKKQSHPASPTAHDSLQRSPSTAGRAGFPGSPQATDKIKARAASSASAPRSPIISQLSQLPTSEAETAAAIRTGDDVVEFYARYGQDSAIKFFYCNRADAGRFFRPYDLVVVRREDVEPEHFNISAAGVMHIRKGMQSEFTPLGEWMRESALFSLLTKINYFKTYLIGRCFRRWHKGVRRKMFQRVRSAISDRLFLAKPTFCASLCTIYAHVSEVAGVKMSYTNPSHLYQLEEFADLQVATREQKAKPALEAIVEKIQQVVEKVCKEAQKQARIYQESIRDVHELEDTTGVELYQGRDAGKARSMIAIKSEKLERARTYKRVMEEAAMLGTFIRLVDYMVVEGVMDRAIATVDELLATLEAPRLAADKLSKGVFLTTISFTEDGMAFTPDEFAVLDVLNTNAIEGTVAVAQGAPRLLFMRSFSHYFDGKPSGLNPINIIRATPHFQGTRMKIDDVIKQDFAAAREYVAIFEEHRKVYDFGRTFTFEAYSSKKRSMREIRRDMHKQREWRNELEKMKIGNVIGCLNIESKTLRNSLIPITTRTLDQVKTLLLGLARESCVASLASLQERIHLLQERPTDLEPFMAYQVLHQRQYEERRQVLQEASTVDDMYDMLSVYEQKVPIADQVKHDELRDAAARLMEELQAGKEFLADHKTEQIGTLETAVAGVNEELLGMLSNLHQGIFIDPETPPAEAVNELEQILERITELKAAAETYAGYQALFALPPDEFVNLAAVEKEADGRFTVWKTLLDLQEKVIDWTTGTLLSMEDNTVRLNIETIRAEVEDFGGKAYRMGKASKEDRVVFALKDELDNFKQVLPIVEQLANPALKDRHWTAIFLLLGLDQDEGGIHQSEAGIWDPFSIDDLLQKGVLEHLEAVAAISSQASKEFSLEKALDKMQADWGGVQFRVVEYKDTQTYIIGGTDDIQAILDDQIVKIQSIRASPYIGPLEGAAGEWDELLNRLQEVVDNWLACQATWQYLEPIFSSPDIIKQMPEEGEKFLQVDQLWREMMESAFKSPDCLAIATDRERLVGLVENNRLLEEIQKGLAAYLELKRIAFPRFFFLSNDEMLEILSETKDPTRVQPHLKKCFEGIDKLQFLPNGDIAGMISAEGEVIPLKTKIKPSQAGGAVEKWLVQVEAGMVESVRETCKQSVAAYAGRPREAWVLEWPGQAVLVVSAIYWTSSVTNALKSTAPGALQAQADTCTAQLADIVGLVRGQLTKLQRATLSALVVMDVHARDVVASLAQQRITNLTDFAWLSQLRMYWEDMHGNAENLTIPIRMMNAQVEYGYEYLGNSGRLVVTPLTDRCYRTLMGAIHLNLGGAPEGPAGTGKTETTKDLAKALARQCVVFNCSDTLDYLTMAKFFKGLASSGAWACFDEFNRIDLEVLSVVAQQVLEIQLAVKAKVKSFFFEGSELPLRPTCNVFITMNPGYAGRSELPDNLKALFRTVAMMVPDYAMISEIMLYSNGYFQARDCARKIVATYKLCSEQLSSQDHYDYGMRAVMAVLRAAGNMKRKFPDENEYILMLRSIVDVNLCKFLSHDVPLFNGIVSDLFPGVTLPAPNYADLHAALRKTCAATNLQPTEYFLTKVVQLYEMIIVRHGLMVVGLPFSGKSSMLSVLAASLSDLHAAGKVGTLFDKIEMRVLNPKSVTMGQLYGETDKATQEWKDGVLAVAFRQLASDPSEARKWLVLDGPVDALWIENMNTVLDDNKKLCLPNSEIIQMSPTMSMIFEVGDLAVASPATVSRCGMVYVEPHQLGWRPLLLSWLTTLPSSLGQTLIGLVRDWFDWLLPACLRFVRKQVKEIAPTLDANLARTAMRIFHSLLDEFRPKLEEEGVPVPTGAGRNVDEVTKQLWVQSLLVFSFVWSLGATGDSEGRKAFDAFFRKLVSGKAPQGYEEYVPKEHPALLVPMMPDTGTVYDYTFNKDTGRWQAWADTLGEVVIPEGAGFSDIIVPTKDSARYTFLLDTAIRHQQPIYFVGPTGTGKSVYMNRHLSQGLPKDAWSVVQITFSARTSASMTQEQVDGRLDKRRKGVYGPPVGKKCVVFVDDLNMPSRETYGAQPPIELLRQFMDYGGWYGRDNVFRSMTDVQFVAAMGPPGGGRTFVTDRYLRHFNCLAFSQVTDDTLVTIFKTILDWHLASGKFPSELCGMSSNIIVATLEMYSQSMAKLLPTPTKSHYTFNLRDFARVIQGVMMLPASKVPEGPPGATLYKRLWVHEVFRVFYDRLVDDADREWLLGQAKKTVQSRLGEHFDSLMTSVSPGEAAGSEITCEHMRRCMFGDYIDSSLDLEDRKYAEVADTTALISTMEGYLVDHNGMSKRPMNLAMFLFAVEHVSRICRVLSQPGGHMLLVGVGGSGRQSLTRLAAFICGMEVTQVEISKSYGKLEWREDLKRVLRRAGGEGKPSVFMFSDTQIKDEAFVEDINNLLNAGEVPNMFPSDEKMQVLEMVRPAAAKAGLESPMELWNFFIAQCRARLHVVLGFSPIGNAFRDRLRQNPSLVNCCTIDWFQVWPKDALEAVAYKFLKDMDLEEATRTKLVALCQSFHRKMRDTSEQFRSEVGRHNYVTPTSYLELISMFQRLLGVKRTENSRALTRYTVGLDKLQSSADQVAGMQKELQELQPQLIKTVGEVEELMKRIDREKVEVVEPKAAAVKLDEEAAQKQADAARSIKEECEGELAAALPILEDALAALDTIKEADITYIKKLGNPPYAIKLVMEAVCVILDVKPAKAKDDAGKPINDYWKPSVGLLNEKDFLNKLKTYDKDSINPKIIERIRTGYLTNDTFTPENAKKASPAAEGMCKWVHAMSSYDKVAKVVAPKKAALKVAEDEFEVVMVGLRAKQADLKELMDKLAAMESDLVANTAKKERLEAEVALCSVKLERAEKLISGLGGEKARWTDTAKRLKDASTDLTGDMLVSAAVIAYLGAFTSAYRQRLTGEFVDLCAAQGIPRSANFSLHAILGEPVKVREWLIAGLPNDSLSIENSIIVANARRWPLMIDPQGQANKWIKNLERSHNLQAIKLSEGGEYLRTLENAIQFGLPVLLENVGEELDPSLEPLLLKQIFKSGGVDCIRLGDATIEYSSEFRFYITTKLRNPHYLPEVAVKVTLLNFMITPAGLSDQMLGVVVAKERPDLEEQRNELVVQSADNKRKLKEIEDKILEVLSSSEGNILEDETAISVITEAKVLGNEITQKQKVAEVTEVEIERARTAYKPCGEYTAILFFCISDLASIDPMYQYSLPWFINLFVASVAAAAKSDSVDERLSLVHDHFTYALYCNVCRSLFEKDKLLFAFLLCSRIMESKGAIDSEEWRFLLTGGLGDANATPNPASSWLVDRAWKELCKLSRLSAFRGLSQAISEQPQAWRPLYDSPAPHTTALPGTWDALSSFRKILIIRCIRPDKVIPAVQDFAQGNLDKRFVEPPPFDLHACYADSTPTCPLIFVLSAGSDPTAALIQFAGDKTMSSRLNTISLGQGQGPKAAAMIAEGVANGNWVVLQNCHLAPSWMPQLDKICDELDAERTHPEFRLWITSYPSPKFPVNILQNGVKMTNEPPKGIRGNMKRSYMLEPIANSEFFEGCTKPVQFKNLLFGLVFFHALIQERRKFGPLGWNIPYGFDDGDQRISVRQLRMFLDENEEIPFAALRYVTGECNYGGRVTDDKDRLLLNTILEKCYCQEVVRRTRHKLSASGLYYVPDVGSQESYLQYIDSLPIIPQPEAFGLHDNADITKDQNDTALIFRSLLAMSGSGGSGTSASVTEAAVAATVRECLARLPAPFDIESVQRKLPVMYEESMNTVLAQEMTRFNRLLHVISDSLRNINLAVQGLLVMSADLEAAYRSISVNQVPEMWAKVSYPSLKPLGSYLEDLYRRLAMLQDWYEKGAPSIFWLPGFFFVQSFLTAGLQNFARKNSIPIDMVEYDFEMLGMDEARYSSPPAEGVYVYGLYLEGCRWDPVAKELAESQPKVLFTPAPCMWLRPKRVEQLSSFPHYNCPLYRTGDRRGVLATTGHSTNFVMFVKLPSGQPASHWIMRGVALLTSLSD